MVTRGILLAGGLGTRLYPLTLGVSKQLLPVYNKPLIYYPLSVLMLAGVREVLVISTPDDLPSCRRLLGDGSRLGMKLSYIEQSEPRGIADAFLVGAEFLKGADRTCLVLGDNLFYGRGLVESVRNAARKSQGAVIFACPVRDPQRFGVVDFDKNLKVKSIEEKPARPRSNYAVVGLYFYDNTVVERARNLTPSGRGELEITALNMSYLDDEKLNVILLGRGIAWLDAGTHDSLLRAATFVEAIETRQGLMISCPEEIAFDQGWIDHPAMERLVSSMPSNEYQAYLKAVLKAHEDGLEQGAEPWS
jgi:glucose-1-phosphate thymidylyltransferase